MLDRQYHLYSIDTGHFFSGREQRLHEKIVRLRNESRALSGSGGRPNAAAQKKRKKELENAAKKALLSLLANKARENERSNGTHHTRAVREGDLTDRHVISVFESALSRAVGIRQDELTHTLILVQVYYFDVFKDLLFHGFSCMGGRFRYFTSSAGQIRQKKALFIRQDVWERVEKTILCGLTPEKINAKGGINVNKYLAYMALSNSATDEWTEFDIDKSIVVEDFETEVSGEFDFVDETDYSITRMHGSVPIPHTDGAGMILPCVSTKNFMFRAPWIKGLLGVFDFRRFLKEQGCSPVITDIYGTRHDVIEEGIEVIFTKSQFKMHQYYDSWESYKACFHAFHCSAGIGSVEEGRIKNASLNYQMLQTLTDVTEEEIGLLTESSAQRIQNICTSKETMMGLLGATPCNTRPTPFQAAVKKYPALLGDTYARDILRGKKNSLVKKYRSGKLEIKGKYTFLLPDFYAACEFWFCHKKRPNGLLGDGEVFCRLFPKQEKLDCLRSPHLYKEHAVRRNAASAAYGERAEKIGSWLTTNGLYASTHDLISKLLMYDVDGDQSLVVADPNFVAIAERNMKGVVPLYYNMQKARPTKLCRKAVYDGLSAAFTGANIGVYSNHISKIWNDDVFQTGSKEERQEAIDCVKRLCCQNNFVIDYAKTLYKPEFPNEVKARIKAYTNAPLPAFFAYAKEKEAAQVKQPNGSLVNQIYSRIPNPPIRMKSLSLGGIRHQDLMANQNIVCSREVMELYQQLNRKYRYMIHMKESFTGNVRYVSCKIREKFHQTGYTDETVADMLVQYLYGGGKRHKQLLWLCYGWLIVKNLEKNIDAQKTRAVQCEDCMEWFEVNVKNTKARRCPVCQKARRNAGQRELMQRRSRLAQQGGQK